MNDMIMRKINDWRSSQGLKHKTLPEIDALFGKRTLALE